jgi:hypothetical protein
MMCWLSTRGLDISTYVIREPQNPESPEVQRAQEQPLHRVGTLEIGYLSAEYLAATCALFDERTNRDVVELQLSFDFYCTAGDHACDRIP